LTEKSRGDTFVPMNEVFLDAHGRAKNKEDVVNEIRSFILERPDSFYKIIIGSDSLQTLGHEADFVTAIVVHRVGNGGRYFWSRCRESNFHTLRDRIIREVMLSLGTSMEILEILKKYQDIKFEFEVHVDVGSNGKTSALISEVTGMVRAYHFNVKTKPESYAASSVADKHV